MPVHEPYSTPPHRTSGAVPLAQGKRMSLLHKGFRFYASPERNKAHWLLPHDQAHFHPDWIDVTDLTSEELLAFLLFKPLPHGKRACEAAQLDIFNDTKEPAA